MTADHISASVDLSEYDGAHFATWADAQPGDQLLVGSWLVEFERGEITARTNAPLAFGPVLVRGTNVQPPDVVAVEHIVTAIGGDFTDRQAVRLPATTTVVRLTPRGDQ